tara:strand:- start:373 stop:954 length:582 start_codon:yes stop_codon:yes gene_type:complete
MLQIFYQDKPIIITDSISDENNVCNIKFKDFKLKSALKILLKKKVLSLRLIANNKKKALKKILKLLPNIKAGGGKVVNSKGEILFIFRNNKWDLPKGKAENNENISETAIREVKEETGIKDLIITKPLQITYHIFKKKKSYILKITYWFEMKSLQDNILIPQIEEGITRAEWIKPSEIEKIKNKCYANIRLLI